MCVYKNMTLIAFLSSVSISAFADCEVTSSKIDNTGVVSSQVNDSTNCGVSRVVVLRNAAINANDEEAGNTGTYTVTSSTDDDETLCSVVIVGPNLNGAVGEDGEIVDEKEVENGQCRAQATAEVVKRGVVVTLTGEASIN